MSSNPDLTRILDDLAAGRIDAAEAARRIEAAKAVWSQPPRTPPAPEPPREEPGTAGGAAGRGVERVSIRSVGRRVRVVGDPAVAGASVEGPHVLRRVGGTLEITSEGQGNPLEGFNLLRLPRSIEELKSMGLGSELVVHVNPSLAVDAEVTASGFASEGVPNFGRIRVTAGGASLKGVRQATDVLVQAGSATIEGTFSGGRSSVRCESGALTVVLADGANVTVRGRAQMGRVSWPGEGSASVDEWVVGNGSGRLEVEVAMGMATIREA